MNKSEHFEKPRLCSQNNFNIIVCGGKSINTRNVVFSDVHCIDAKTFYSVNTLSQLKRGRTYFKAVCIKKKQTIS